MASETMVFGANLRRSEKWRLFRIRTANSTYELELESAPGTHGRRCAVLTRIAPAGESFTDSSPMANENSLFASSPMEWMGKCLVVGTARTSEVQSVDFVGANDRPVARKTASTTMPFGAAPRAAEQTQHAAHAEPKPREWAPFPLSHVEMAETAAMLLKAIVHRADLFPALKGDELAERRMTLSLAECRLMLEALNRRV
jgi:hypothetical protein